MNIRLESTNNGGSSFNFNIHSPKEKLMEQKLNCIMVIDDDEPTNFLSNMIIEEAGCTNHIQIEDSVAKALNYLRDSANRDHHKNEFPVPDLIFLDINMPAMNGWEFLEKYNRLEYTSLDKIKIVMLTTSLDPDDIIKAKKINGVVDFKHKPLTEQILNEVLQEYFPALIRKG
ncbi:MAG: response regulator [Ginsengibacter sp.]